MITARFTPSLLVVGLVFSYSVGALRAQPPLSSMQFLPGDNTVGPAAGDQVSPFISKGATDYLVVWVDKRSNLTSILPDVQSSSDIYATRVNAAGVVDSIPIVINQQAGQQVTPRVAWNGQNWLVAWISQEPTGSYYSNRIVGVRVSPQGVVLDSPPLTISTTDFENPFDFALASDSSNWVVVWSGNSAGSTDLKGARVTAGGTVLDPGGITVIAGTYYVYSYVDVAYTNGSYLVVWEDLSDCRGVLVDTELQPLPTGTMVLSQSETISPRVAASPTGFLVTFGQYVSTTYFEGIYSRTVSLAGQLGTVNQLFGTYTGTPSLNLHVVWDGGRWIVNWNQSGNSPLRLARVSPLGAVLDAGGVAITSGLTEHIAPGANGGLAAVYSNASSGTSKPKDIYFSTINSDFELGAATCLSLSAPSQIQSHLAGAQEHWMITYLSVTSAACNVMAMPLGVHGTPLASQPTLVATGLRLSSPSIAWDGSRFLVTWHGDSDSVYARRISGEGVPIDESPIAVMPGYTSDVAAMDDLFLVVSTWKVFGNPHYVFPTAVRMRGHDAALLDSPALVIGNMFARRPRVERVGNRWLIAYEQHPSHDAPDNAVVGSFIDSEGLGSGPFMINGDLYANRFKYAPDLASNGSTSLVAWHDHRLSSTDWNLQASRVEADQTVLDYPGFSVAALGGDQMEAAVGFDGSEFVVAYEDQRANLLFFDERTDLYVTRVAQDGSPLSAEGVPFSTGPSPDMMPSVASDHGSTLIAGSVFRDDAPFASYRLGLRSWSTSAALAGDTNGDGTITSADVVYLVGYVFKGGEEPKPCAAVGDVNCTSTISSADIVLLVNHVFKGGPAPCTARGLIAGPSNCL